VDSPELEGILMEPGERANTKFHEMANKFHDFWRQTRNTHSSTSSNRPMLLHIGILTCQLLCALAAHGLVDHPIASEFNPTYLDSQWRLTGPGVDVDATVPGDLITDLQRGNVIGDPLFGLNFANTLWDSGDFIYTRRFDANEILNSNVAQVMLVFDSIKMASIIELNGQSVGITTNQFRRYTFDVLPLLRSFNNTLTVRFVPSNHSLNANARFMSCSGAWDWAPYSNTFTVNGTHTFTKGIVRSVYLLPIANVAITYIVPQVFYLGARPTSPLSSSDAATFRLQVRVHLHVSGVMKNPVQVSITGEGPGGNIPVTGSVFAPRGNTFIDLTVDPISAVDLWWPRGLGSQNMYNISVSAQSSPTMAAVAKRRIGFRAVDLVTTDDATSTSGSGDFTMRFRINGASPVLRGANMIPMEELEGRQTAEVTFSLTVDFSSREFNFYFCSGLSTHFDIGC
jgi:beta-galactosidase/beta-glucuronidase